MGTDIIAEREQFLSPEPTVYTPHSRRGPPCCLFEGCAG